MQPADLQAEQFGHYPPLGRRLAIQNLAILRELPLVFLPLLLKEVSTYDWKFPVERQELDSQFAYLRSLPPQQLIESMAAFAHIQAPSIPPEVDWVNYPQVFSEYLSAALWSNGQVDAFRAASIAYVNAYRHAQPPPTPPIPCLTMVVVGAGVNEASFPLFRKLRPHGVYYSRIQAGDANKSLHQALTSRADAHPMTYGHWYVDGGRLDAPVAVGVTTMSYDALSSLRLAVVERMRTLGHESRGPEGLQKMMAALDPAEFPELGASDDPVMSHFRLSVFTEGSGTQFYSTTFTQWTAHELLRRAQPITALIRFAPRQVQRSFDEMILDKGEAVPIDPQGSLMDADMGAFYIWLNQRRLPRSEEATFVVWFENHSEALMIAPHLTAGTESHAPLSFEDLLKPVSYPLAG